MTALLNAAAYNRADCVRLLLEFGADKEAKDIVRGTLFSSDLDLSPLSPFLTFFNLSFFSFVLSLAFSPRSLLNSQYHLKILR